MNNLKYIFSLTDIIIVAGLTFLMFNVYINNPALVYSVTAITTACAYIIFCIKGIYEFQKFDLRFFRKLTESFIIMTGIVALIIYFSRVDSAFIYIILTILICVFILLALSRGLYSIIRCFCTGTKNVLIVGAGQDGKLIAEEIQKRPNLRLKVVGFLDDNMNTIEDEDSTIPILGLTCDSEAVIKDNNVKLVIIAVKSRMDSNILTDLVRGIPLGVKVWRMYRFYEKITHKYLVSKMSVNWLFYDCVRKTALLYSYLKRICDIIASVLILFITSPLSLIAIIGIKLSDLGPIFFTQTRIGQLGKPFRMIKFRTMYQDKVEDDFDDDLTEVTADDLRIMPFGKILRKFHIDEIPQMINVLRGDMSIVGPRPVREEVYEENKSSVPFWECRNWVRPGWCGWQQLNVNEPTAEERLGYDLYYIKHRQVWWEFSMFFRYTAKVILGKARGK